MIEWVIKNPNTSFQWLTFLFSIGKRLRSLWQRWRNRTAPRNVPLILLKNVPPCYAGEIAGYPPARATKLVASGDARYYRRVDRFYSWCRAIVALGGPA